MSQTVELALIAAAVGIVTLVLVYRLLRRNPYVGATRFGFFIERDYQDGEDGLLTDQETKVLWPKKREGDFH